MVLRVVPYGVGLVIIPAVLLVLDRNALKSVDWGLLLTFAAFFTFSGNLARIDAVQMFFARLLSHGTMLVSAAILLSRFTQDYQGLLIGVNVGGAGTLIASLASLITFREFAKHKPAQTGRFLLLFLAVSFGFLAVLLGAMSLLGQA